MWLKSDLMARIYFLLKTKNQFLPFGLPLLSHQLLCCQLAHPPPLCLPLLTTVTCCCTASQPPLLCPPLHCNPLSSCFPLPSAIIELFDFILFYVMLFCVWDLICDWFLLYTSTTWFSPSPASIHSFLYLFCGLKD